MQQMLADIVFICAYLGDLREHISAKISSYILTTLRIMTCLSKANRIK